MDREIKKYRYAFALIFTILIFSMGMLFSNLMDDYRTDTLSQELENDIIEMESRQIQMNYLDRGERSCQTLQRGLESITSSYNDRLDRIEQFRDSPTFQQEQFERLKHRYTLSGAEYWMFAENVKEQCDDYNPDTVLFFREENCQECEDQGQELSRIKNVHGEDVLIFSIYTDIDDGMVNILKQEHNVERRPTLIINQETKLEGYHHREDILQNLNVE